MDLAFDEGHAWPEAVERHAVSCAECSAYRGQLEGLDTVLRNAPPVEPDPVLAARIQATIATRQTYGALPWIQVAGLGAAVALLAGAGWFVDTRRIIQALSRLNWMPEGPLLPETYLMRSEFAEMPAAIRDLLLAAIGGLSEWWGQGTRVLAGVTGGDSAWIWAGFVACLVLAVALNGREFVSRSHHHSRTSNG